MPLTIATWNCAHGRGVGSDLRRLRRAGRQDTLAAIGATLRDRQVEVAALQELDGASWWSGRFDHGEVVAAHGGFRFGLHGHHVHWAGLRCGAALLSRHPLAAPTTHRFAPSFPTPSKGFVAARTDLDGRDVDVVSVHLDFARRSVRRAQLLELEAFLGGRRTPSVVLGDFNAEAHSHGVADFARSAGLQVRPPPRVTFPKLRRRLDLVLLSPGLLLDDLQVLPLDLSDHRPVLARVRWA